MASKSTHLHTHNMIEALQRLDANDIAALSLFSYAEIGESGATSISNSLIKNTSLTHLDLERNEISPSGATSISNTLIKNTSLTHLDLSSNSISDSGAISISNSLIKNTSLTFLDLADNLIKDVSVLKLIKDELTTNKDPCKLQTKKEQLLAWNSMKILLNENACLDNQ